MVWFQKTSACVKWRKAKRRRNRRCAPGASTFRPSWSVPGTCGDESSRTAKRKAMTPAPQKKTTGFQTEKKQRTKPTRRKQVCSAHTATSFVHAVPAFQEIPPLLPMNEVHAVVGWHLSATVACHVRRLVPLGQG